MGSRKHLGPALVLVFLLMASSTGAAVPADLSELPPLPLISASPQTQDSVPPPAAEPAYIDPLLAEELDRAGLAIAILVLDAAQSRTAIAALRALGLDLHEYEALHMAAVRLPAQLLEVVAHVPGVLVVYRDETAHGLLEQAVPYVGATTVWKTYRLRGSAATVFVVDSGIDGSHPDLRYGENLIENAVPVRDGGLVRGSQDGVRVSDVHGHGTHVAGVVGGTGRAVEDGHKYRGVTPSARLVGYQAGVRDHSDGDVTFDSVSVLEAFNYAIKNQKRLGIRVVTNSWGANGDFDPRAPINLATLSLYKLGMVVVFAAGNEGGSGAQTLNKFSVAPWVLAVSAGDYLNRLAPFSSRGSDPKASGRGYDHPDLVAPGIRITSASPVSTPGRDGQARPHTTPHYYRATSGTSIAAPMVAGIAALLLQANPHLSPDQVMDILTATATRMPGYAVWDVGAGYANALDAYRLAVRTPGQRDAFLDGRVKYAGRESGDPRFERDAVTVGYGEGRPTQLRDGAQSLLEFLESLVTTIHGVVFLGGTALLLGMTFGIRPRPSLRRARPTSTSRHRPWSPPQS